MARISKGEETRGRLMDIAEESILAKGFGATSIDEIIEAADITKSGFFYHFPDKTALAKALLTRYIDKEEELLDDLFGRAADLHEDPLHIFLIGLKLLADMMADLPGGHPGCLIATFCYNDRLFDRDIRDLNNTSILAWRTRFRTMIDRIMQSYEPVDEVDLDGVADMLLSVTEGGIVLSRSLNDPVALSQQILLYRSYIKLLFRPRQA